MIVLSAASKKVRHALHAVIFILYSQSTLGRVAMPLAISSSVGI